MKNSVAAVAAKSKVMTIMTDGNSKTVGVGVGVLFGKELASGVGVGAEAEVGVEVGAAVGTGVGVGVGRGVCAYVAVIVCGAWTLLKLIICTEGDVTVTAPVSIVMLAM